MGAGGFLGGLMSGFANETKDRQKAGKTSILSRLRKRKNKPAMQGSGNTGAVGAGDVIGSFKKGGRVKKTGKYMLHKGEKVVPKRAKKRGKKSSKRR
jgi:hypothetical protein